MDGAWALYESWIKIQTGEVRQRAGLLVRQVVARRSRRGAGAPARPLHRDAALARRRQPGRDPGARLSLRPRARPSATSPRSQRAVCATRSTTRTRWCRGSSTSRSCWPSRTAASPLRAHDCPPITDGASARGDRDRDLARGAVRAAGVDPRLRPPHRAPAPRRARSGARAVDRDRGAEGGRLDGTVLSTSPSCHAPYTHQELILREALGLSAPEVASTPRGDALARTT